MFQPPSELIEKFAIGSDMVVMDFGCGLGFLTVEAAKKAKRVIAVDLAPEMRRKAEKKSEKEGIKNVEFLQATAEDSA